MHFDALTLSCVAAELRATLLGGRVQAILLPDELSIGLEVYAGRRRHYLLATAHPELCRISLAAEKLRRGVEKESGLLLLLRKYVHGAILAGIEQPPFERILHITFEHALLGPSRLVVELMGRHSNLILVRADGHILDAAKRIGPQLSAARPVLPGLPYHPPPAQDKLAPTHVDEAHLAAWIEGAGASLPAWKVLVSSVKGMSPLLAREIVHRAELAGRADARGLLAAMHSLLAPLETGDWQPSLVLRDGRPEVAAPYPLLHRGAPLGVASMSQALEQVAAAAASRDPYAAAKRTVRATMAKAQARLEARRDSLERAVAEAAESEQWRTWGEWILAYAHTVRPRQAVLTADTGSGDPLEIPLDPDLTPSENAQAYFRRYRKAQRASAGGPDRLREVTLALRDLEQLATDLELAASRPDIEAVRAALEEGGLVRSRPGRPARHPPTRPLALTSPDGLAVLVGRNSRQNDELTFRRAGGDDWWFHARGVPGAHVIVRSGVERLPPETLAYAAGLAAYYSRARSEAEAIVDYTRRRHVRRIPGAAPGLVSYTDEESIRVAPSRPEGAGR